MGVKTTKIDENAKVQIEEYDNGGKELQIWSDRFRNDHIAIHFKKIDRFVREELKALLREIKEKQD